MDKEKLAIVAVRKFIQTFDKVKYSNYIRKPVAYALYETWKEIDQKEKEHERNS